MIPLKFIPLTFISSHDEIVKHIQKTVVFALGIEVPEKMQFDRKIKIRFNGF